MNLKDLLSEQLILESNSEDNCRKEKISRMKELRALLRKYAEMGGLTKIEAKDYINLSKEHDLLYYDLEHPLSIDKIPSPEQRQSTLPSDIVLTARQDIRKNKSIYIAITSATHGVFHDAETSIDDIMNGKNSEISAWDLYNAFDATRESMRKHYGSTITLFRAIGKQIKKPTTNWATTVEFAKQFGNNVISKEIPIDNVIAVQVRGSYHEIIVGEPPKVVSNLKEGISKYKKYMVSALSLNFS